MTGRVSPMYMYKCMLDHPNPVIDCVWRLSYSAMFVTCFLFVVNIIYILSRLMVERLQ